MDYQQYKQLVLGKRVDIDRKFGYQCVDLVKHAFLKMYGRAVGKTGNANQMRANRYRIFGADRSKSKDINGFQPGDVIFAITGKFRHVCLFDHYEGNKTVVLEQNGIGGGKGLGGNAIRLKAYPKSFFIGGWRHK